MVEELAEDGHEAVEGRSQADIGRHMVDDQAPLRTGGQPVMLQGVRQEVRGLGGCSGSLRLLHRGIVIRLRLGKVGLRGVSHRRGGVGLILCRGQSGLDRIHAVGGMAVRSQHRPEGLYSFDQRRLIDRKALGGGVQKLQHCWAASATA